MLTVFEKFIYDKMQLEIYHQQRRCERNKNNVIYDHINKSKNVYITITARQSYTVSPGIYFVTKTNKEKITIKSTQNSLTRSYFLIYPLISRCENLKMLSEYSLHDILL